MYKNKNNNVYPLKLFGRNQWNNVASVEYFNRLMLCNYGRKMVHSIVCRDVLDGNRVVARDFYLGYSMLMSTVSLPFCGK